MFKNLEELKQEIRAGKTNEQIIQERLQYLKSDEYKKARQATVKRQGTKEVLFHDGYIQEDEEIAFASGDMDVLYSMDEIKIFNKLIDLVRQNMDKPGLKMGDLINIVNGYFSSDMETSKYYEIAQYLKEFGKYQKQPLFAREVLPKIIVFYNNSSFQGSMLEFTKGFLNFHNNLGKSNPEYQEYGKRYSESMDFEKIDSLGDASLPISAIKGLKIAACTEKAMLIQNCLAFLGYDSYMLAGTLSSPDKKERHQFNVVRVPNSDKFIIVDAEQCVPAHVIEGVHSLEEVRSMKNIKTTTRTVQPKEISYDVDDLVAVQKVQKDKKDDDYDDR